MITTTTAMVIIIQVSKKSNYENYSTNLFSYLGAFINFRLNKQLNKLRNCFVVCLVLLSATSQLFTIWMVKGKVQQSAINFKKLHAIIYDMEVQ